MLLRCVLGDKQHEYLSHRLAIGRIERDGFTRPDERRERVVEALDAAVRDRDTLSEAGRAELLAREQTIEHGRTRDLRAILEQLTDLLEQALFARRLDIEHDVRFGQELRDLIHAGLCAGSDVARRRGGAELYASRGFSPPRDRGRARGRGGTLDRNGSMAVPVAPLLV